LVEAQNRENGWMDGWIDGWLKMDVSQISDLQVPNSLKIQFGVEKSKI
jgi:hypothetical protein